MKLVIHKIFIFLAFFTCSTFATTCQSGGNEESFHNYDFLKFFKKSAEHINTSKKLKLLSENDKEFLNEFEKFFPVSVNSTLLDTFSEGFSEKCVKDWKYMFENLLSPGGWAMKMLDSYGKPGSGILLGNINWLGEYEECVGIHAPSKENSNIGDFRGKYCTLHIPLELEPLSFTISTAVCLPDSCSPNGTIGSIGQNFNLNGSSSDLSERLKSAFNNATLTCKATSKKLTTGAIFVICLLSVFALLAVIGSFITAFEHFMKAKLSNEYESGVSTKDNPANSDVENISQGFADDGRRLHTEVKTVLPGYLEKYKPFFNCFCIITNGEKLLNISSSEGQLPCLHGIRFLSMTWVILCHSYGVMQNIVKNIREAANYTDHWTFQIILNGFFCVDSFFVLSGFLVGYLFFQQAQKTGGKFPWLYYYIHRYIRLTPVYMLVIAFFTTISPFLGSGPLWPDYDVIEYCKESWWRNLLYINNFQSINFKQCMAWSWFLANDMQFYVISPLFLITLWRWPKIGHSIVGLFFVITITCNFALTYKYDLMAGFGNILEHYEDIQKFLPRMNAFYDILYSKPYTRIGSYLVGLVLAYYIYRRKRSNSPNLNWGILSAGWLVATGVTLACQFGLYHQDVTTLGAAFYNALSRISFSMGLGWVIFVCVIGQGGVVNNILSWKAFIPLSRLSYCAYLVHPIVFITYSSSVRSFMNFNHINSIMVYLCFLIISYAVAMVTSLMFESPVIRLERLIRNKLAS